MGDNRSAFDSGDYDRRIRQTLPYYDAFYEQTAELVKVFHPGPVSWLDAGCGTGKMAAALEPEALERFVFCDTSEPMIRLARERFSFPGAEFTVCDVRELPYDSEFDVITAILVLHYLRPDERRAALRKCFAALKPGGLLITFENFAPCSAQATDACLEKWRRFQIAQGKTPGEAEAHIGRYGRGYFPITLPEHREVMRECGFETAEILWLSNMQVGIWGLKRERNP